MHTWVSVHTFMLNYSCGMLRVIWWAGEYHYAWYFHPWKLSDIITTMYKHGVVLHIVPLNFPILLSCNLVIVCLIGVVLECI